jgi:hypothetical protein
LESFDLESGILESTWSPTTWSFLLGVSQEDLESGIWSFDLESTWSLDSGVYLKDFLLGVFYLESFDLESGTLESDFLIRERPLRPLFNKKCGPGDRS